MREDLNSAEERTRKRFDIRLSGSIQNLLVVGAVSTLKDRPKLRTLSASLGLFLVILGIFSFFVLNYELRRFASPLAISGAALLLVSTLSRPEYNLFIAEPREVEERKIAEETESTSRDPYSALDVASKRLNEYYALNQSQARGSFRWAIFAMSLGFTTIITGIWVFYFRDTPNTFLTSLSTAAGIMVNLISAWFLYLHNGIQRRSLYYYNQLVRLQQVGLVIRVVETYETDGQRAQARDKVIDEILKIVHFSAEEDAKSVAKEMK